MSRSGLTSTTEPLVRLEDAPDVLTVPEAAHYLRIGRNAAYEAVQRGELYAVRIGGSLRVPKAAVLRMLDPQPVA
jgi:excisionase family DNA binding protein